MRTNSLRKLTVACGVLVAVAAMASPSWAAKFAQFSQVPASPGPNVLWNNPGNTTSASLTSGLLGRPTAVPIQFSFLGIGSLSGIHNVNSVLVLNSGVTATPAVGVGGVVDQPGLAGSFQILYNGVADIVIGATHYHTGANLLSGVFASADVAGKGTVGAAFGATASGSTVTFTSDFINFASSVKRDFVLNLDAISPVLAANPGKALRTFTANADGAFAATGVPEPSTWAVMIVGLGMIGGVYRRRRALAT